MIFLLQQFHGRIVEQPHPFVGLGRGSEKHAEKTKKAGRAGDADRSEKAERAPRVNPQMNLRLGQFHRSVPSTKERIQGADGVQISNLKFQM
jgi:hypothetical protein